MGNISREMEILRMKQKEMHGKKMEDAKRQRQRPDGICLAAEPAIPEAKTLPKTFNYMRGNKFPVFVYVGLNRVFVTCNLKRFG